MITLSGDHTAACFQIVVEGLKRDIIHELESQLIGQPITGGQQKASAIIKEVLEKHNLGANFTSALNWKVDLFP